MATTDSHERHQRTSAVISSKRNPRSSSGDHVASTGIALRLCSTNLASVSRTCGLTREYEQVERTHPEHTRMQRSLSRCLFSFRLLFDVEATCTKNIGMSKLTHRWNSYLEIRLYIEVARVCGLLKIKYMSGYAEREDLGSKNIKVRATMGHNDRVGIRDGAGCASTQDEYRIKTPPSPPPNQKNLCLIDH